MSVGLTLAAIGVGAAGAGLIYLFRRSVKAPVAAQEAKTYDLTNLRTDEHWPYYPEPRKSPPVSYSRSAPRPVAPPMITSNGNRVFDVEPVDITPMVNTAVIAAVHFMPASSSERATDVEDTKVQASTPISIDSGYSSSSSSSGSSSSSDSSSSSSSSSSSDGGSSGSSGE